MPRRDGTGPTGFGPLTGRGKGGCIGYGQGFGRGCGNRFGGRFGRGGGFGQGFNQGFYGYSEQSFSPTEFANEQEFLKNKTEVLEKALTEVRARLAEIEDEK